MPDSAPGQTPPILTLDIDHNARPIVVRCHGKLVAGVGDILYNQVKPLLPEHKRIILDLTELTRMDSLGLGTLARLYVSARSAGCNLELMTSRQPDSGNPPSVFERPSSSSGTAAKALPACSADFARFSPF